MTAERPAEPFRVLVVCTGNICRSPFAAALLETTFARIARATRNPEWRERVEVSSAGTIAMTGRAIEPQMSALLPGYDAVERKHVARQLDRELVATADLILGLSREHRREIVTLLPSASRRVFAFNEFARLLDDAVSAQMIAIAPSAPATDAMAEVVDAASMRRGFALAPDDPGVDDVVDPYGRDDLTYAASGSQIAAIARHIESSVLIAAGVTA